MNSQLINDASVIYMNVAVKHYNGSLITFRYRKSLLSVGDVALTFDKGGTMFPSPWRWK